MKDYDQILIALRRIMRAIDLHSQQLFRATALTSPQLLVMQAIEKEGSPSTSMLARHLVVSQATMTRIVDRLEKAGMVRREKSTHDKRVTHVKLTNAGNQKLVSAPEPLQAEFLRKYRTLTDWEQLMLTSSLLRIAHMMDAADLDAAPILQSGEIVPITAPEEQ